MDKTLPGHLDIDGIRRDENGKKIIIDDIMLPNNNYKKNINELKNNKKNFDIKNKNTLSKQDILKSRKNKDKNKSKIANHNRKKNSNKKMNKGMF